MGKTPRSFLGTPRVWEGRPELSLSDMTTPKVTEIRRPLEAVTPDPFIAGMSDEREQGALIPAPDDRPQAAAEPAAA